ncbi:potassium transporter Kup [Stigmatella aurantiaca]|uniref:Probable potassium transport system protein Kup n=1 Tax=Stigmatella aurantiaca (strain DW4/3-1) TaxID=378806 RepID=E3FPY3_STIAD|nr:KUP/HAK/KT family potassium transporter [Stigmatella aurantiaca]ADO75686.1 potassium transport system protein kup [Stigmatella aurantiaca DW4/3-1]
MTGPAPHRREASGPARPWLLVLSAMGVVFGDLGTSPLYALQESFHGPEAVAVTPGNILGVLSLFIWSLLLVVCLKYLTLLMRVDNHGEGGILALVALLRQGPARRGPGWAVGLGLFGAALLYGDGVITPAISVLSAVEGLKVATPIFEPYVVPLTVVILLALFAVQPLGTGKVGGVFGPIVALWFVSIGALGAWGVAHAPEVLAAFNPWHAVRFFQESGWHGVRVLGAVILCLTGAEALYADMGGFGRSPIRRAWFMLALPALVLSYLSQGAWLLHHPGSADAPFFRSLPAGALYPMVALATLATVVASQALISAVFSLTHQAIQLGYCPPMHIVHTSRGHMGQIYLPGVNGALMIACVGVVLGFRSSGALAAAYGVAVAGTMLITTVLFAAVVRERWHWPVWGWLPVVGGFLVLDLSFLGANLLKVVEGGWFPLAIGAAAFLLMEVWQRGRRLLIEHHNARGLELNTLLQGADANGLPRVKGTAVFLSGILHGAPLVLVHHLQHNRMLHEHVVLLTVHTEPVPAMGPSERVSQEPLGPGITRVVARYGYMEHPDVPDALRRAREFGLTYPPEEVTYYVGRVSIRAQRGGGVPRWLKRLYGVMQRNAHPMIDYVRLPSQQVMELGARIDL